VAYDEEGIVINKDHKLMAYGPKKLCKFHLEILQEKLKKEKSNFVNWDFKEGFNGVWTDKDEDY
jgi:hypothetical protein